MCLLSTWHNIKPWHKLQVEDSPSIYHAYSSVRMRVRGTLQHCVRQYRVVQAFLRMRRGWHYPGWDDITQRGRQRKHHEASSFQPNPDGINESKQWSWKTQEGKGYEYTWRPKEACRCWEEGAVKDGERRCRMWYWEECVILMTWDFSYHIESCRTIIANTVQVLNAGDHFEYLIITFMFNPQKTMKQDILLP